MMLSRALIAIVLAVVVAARYQARMPANMDRSTLPGVQNCTTKWATQFIDNFGWDNKTYQQRYLVNEQYYVKGGPIFFYNGNEGNVELYANTCGLMWENAPQFNALIVFAEHRYFGESLPCPGGFRECGNYLGTDQAMADYARLIAQLRTEYGATSTVVFGGSYGGMLAAWMRMRYPGLVDGAIASSAPIGCLSPDYDGESYWKVVSNDATSAGKSAPLCAQNVNKAINDVITLMKDAAGRATIKEKLGVCNKELTEADTNQLLMFIQAGFDSLAMGDYPYPTYYISGDPKHPAPAWPMRAACQYLKDDLKTPEDRLSALAKALGVVDNITQSVECYNISGLNPSVYSAIWDFMVCTECQINEQPYFAATGWPNDMFWKQPVYTKAMYNAHCEKNFGVTPRYGFLYNELGVKNIPASSNIVFANGGYDPWHSGGIMQNISDSLVALFIPDGAHHLDLFFTNPADPPSVREVRGVQIANIRFWIQQAREKFEKKKQQK